MFTLRLFLHFVNNDSMAPLQRNARATFDGLRISDGLVSHTVIEGNSIGSYVIRDYGYNTVYQLQYVVDISQIAGTPHNRRGWVGLATSVVQLH